MYMYQKVFFSYPIGKPHASGNPLLDSQQRYEVEYANGETEVIAASILAENILGQVDENGFRDLMMDEITDHRRNDDAVPKDKGTFLTPSGTTRQVRTTKGWEFSMRWKRGSQNWIALKDLKNSYPLEVAEYAESHNFLDEPAFAWWAPFVLKKK